MIERRPQFEFDFGVLDHIGEWICTGLLIAAASYIVGRLLWAWHTGAIARLVLK